MRKAMKILALILALCLTAGLFGACTKTDGQNPGENNVNNVDKDAAYGTTLDDIKANGKLVIGLDDTFAPMGFRDEAGNLVGFDIDLAKAVCEKLGVEAVFQPISWDAKEMELSTGRIDCIWNGMSVTPEREEQMALSSAYLKNHIIIMTNPNVAVASLDDLKNVKIGTQAKSSALEAMEASDLYDEIKDNISEYATYDEVILDMKAGRIDVMVIDEVLGAYKNSKMDNYFGVAEANFGEDEYAIGFRKGDTELRDAVNDVLAALMSDGTADKISDDWFGESLLIKE